VLLTGLLARDLGGGRIAQWLAAACGACAVIVLFTGHLLSTSTFDLLAWTAVTWLAVRAVRTGNDRLWLAVGVVLGAGLLNKPLPAFLGVALVAGVAVAGPRRLLRSPYVWSGAAIAVVLWSPWLIWQAAHHWPQIDVSRSIAGGGSTSSQPWWAIVPFQVLLVSPPLAPLWIAGLVRLFRQPELRDVRFLAWAWVVLVVTFMATGGKPYYLAGLLPALIAAGAVQAEGWLSADRGRARRVVVGAVLAASGLAGDGAVLLTGNYGEAGAIDRYGPGLGLPNAYSGHNAYGDWGPPPDGDAPVVAIGLPPRLSATYLRGCTEAARIASPAGVDNEEAGTPVLAARSGTILRIDTAFNEWSPAEEQAAFDAAQLKGYTPEATLDRIRGRQVWIDHGEDIGTRYAHLSAVAPLRVGDVVTRGQVIGAVGSSGYPEGGPHLHFEIRDGEGFYGDGLPLPQLRYALGAAFR